MILWLDLEYLGFGGRVLSVFVFGWELHSSEALVSLFLFAILSLSPGYHNSDNITFCSRCELYLCFIYING